MKWIHRWTLGSYVRTTLSLAVFAAPHVARAQLATITGRVTSGGSAQPLVDSRVMIVGEPTVVSANADGRYTLHNVAPGTVTVRVLRVGYQESKKDITVAAGQTGTLDFVLTPAIVQLQEIVTTATGDQRRVELGNAVATLGDVTTKVQTEPVSNIADLMVAKTAGVTVVPGAMTGAAPNIHVRGIGSLATTGSGITNNPIYIVDGVRVVQNTVSFGFTGTQGSLLNDIDPNEIEDVEIVKGPSAATLYGTDAANGVIVITTHKGHAGATRWTWWGEGGTVDDRNKYPTDYASWGHNATTGALQRCTLITESQKTCVLDSLTSFNVLDNPLTTPNQLGSHGAGGMSASGGTDAVRFYVSADLQNEIGPITMPNFAKGTLDSMGTALRDEWVHPEAFQSYSTRVNLNAAFSPQVDFSANAGFSNTNNRLPQVDNNILSVIYSALNNPGFNHNGLNYTETSTLNEYRNGYGGYSPAQIFQDYRNNDTQRLMGSADMAWHPYSWMQNEGTAGIDLADNQNIGICRFGECPNSGTLRQGQVIDNQLNFRNFSAKLVSNSTWQARRWATFKTTVGADYTNIESDGVSASSTNLPPGAQTVGSGAVPAASNTLQTVNKTLGLYVQEEGSFRDRMFLTLAERTDQNSSFGTNFQQVYYPKASLSWVLSDESFFPRSDWLNTFRLRTAYGASGVQPGGTVSLQTYTASSVNLATTPGATGGTDTPGLRQNALGNPNLKPERSAEFEGGFESSVIGNRLHIDATYYHKKTSDALISLPIAASSGAAATSVLDNLASTSNSGYELTLTSTLIDRRMLGWDIVIAASHNSQKVLSLGNDLAGKPVPAIVSGSTRDSVGLPINAWVVRPFTYADSNHDGIITPNEVTVGSGFAYAGYSSPRDIVSITNGFDLINHKLRITILTDYKGGYGLYNQSSEFFATNFATWSSENLTSTSLWDQARNVAASSAKNPNTVAGYIENGQFWKLREVSAALTMPQAVANKLRAHDAQIVFSARNLHTWTSYTGTDPESNYSTGDVQTDFATTAPRSYFLLRANLHY